MNALGGKLAHVYVPVARPDCSAVFELVSGPHTEVPGLAVLPELSETGSGFTGLWQIAHIGTGAPIGAPYAEVEEALAAAPLLREVLKVDWRRTPFAHPGDVEHVCSQVRQLLMVSLPLAAG